MRSIGTWLRTRPVHLRTLIAANVIALFSVPWLTGLVLQIASLLVVFFFIYAYHQAGTR